MVFEHKQFPVSHRETPVNLPPDSSHETIDCRAVLDIVGGDQELLRELIGLFQVDCPRLLRELRMAVAAGDAAAVRRVAHTLAGNSVNFGVHDVPDLARRLERMGREGNLTGAPALVDELATAVINLCQGLAKVAKSTIK
jgi:HPt (histidine-containing phosphotransfer) domain-containing protein